MVSRILKLNIVKYFIFSCSAALIDFIMSYLLYKKLGINYLLASSIGIILGFIFQYFTSMKFIFINKHPITSLVIYIATFLFALILAAVTIWVSFELIKLSFIISKFLSAAIPFFITYFIRKKLLKVKLNAIKVG